MPLDAGWLRSIDFSPFVAAALAPATGRRSELTRGQVQTLLDAAGLSGLVEVVWDAYVQTFQRRGCESTLKSSIELSIESSAGRSSSKMAAVVDEVLTVSRQARSALSHQWTVASWLSSLQQVEGDEPMLVKIVANQLKQNIDDNGDELSAVRALWHETGSTQTLRERLIAQFDGGRLVEKLADLLVPSLQSTATAGFPSAHELHSRFFQESSSLLFYAGLDTFYGGLERIVGPPRPDVEAAMRSEHVESEDSTVPFTTDKYCSLASKAPDVSPIQPARRTDRIPFVYSVTASQPLLRSSFISSRTSLRKLKIRGMINLGPWKRFLRVELKSDRMAVR